MVVTADVPLKRARRALPAGLLAAAIVAGFAYAAPPGDRNAFVETTIWSLLVMVSFAGWGSLVKALVAPDDDVDLGLRVAWGASATCFVGGVLMVPAAMTHPAALVIVDVGLLGALAELLRRREGVRRSFAFVLRVARREPKLACVALLLGALVALRYLGGIANWRINPYDDDIAYVPFVQRLLQTGTLLEPFSIRRLSALGGQSFFLELVAIRASAVQALTFDRSMSVLMVVLLLVGHRDRGRRPSLVFLFIATAFILTVPSTASNTASAYSGVAFFLALFRTLVWVGGKARAPWRNAIVLALVSSATCTLRQSYLPIPVLLLGASYLAWWINSRRTAPAIREASLVLGFTVVALLPWFIVAWQSNRTFLYPIILGNSNPAMALRGVSTTLASELVLMLATAQEGLKVTALGVLVFATALVREAPARKPLWALVFATLVSFVMLVHGLTSSDAPNVGRYAFGSVVAMVLAILLVAATRPERARETRDRAFSALVLFGSLAALVASQTATMEPLRAAVRNVASAYRAAPRSQTAPPEEALYLRLQKSIPEGERIFVMLDEPHRFNYLRNPILNVDTAGYASPAPGLPYFQGSQRLEEYLHTIGVRYVAYVQPGFSRYHYRREYWLEMLNDESDIWRTHAPYFLDLCDNLTEIAGRHRRAFEERGLAVIDLGADK